MENKRIKINEILIFYIGIFILFSFSVNDFSFFLSKPVMITILIALFAFIIPILANVGINANDLNIVFTSISYVIFGLSLLLLLIMIIRGIIGIIKVKKFR